MNISEFKLRLFELADSWETISKSYFNLSQLDINNATFQIKSQVYHQVAKELKNCLRETKAKP